MPKSETVWFEEVNRALLKLLKENIQVPIEGVLKPVEVSVQKAEEDFKVDTYPAITIYAVNFRSDRKQLNTLTEVITEVDTEKHTGKLEKVPKAFILNYKITLWSKFQYQMDRMTMKLAYLIGDFYNLDVFNASGDKTSCFMELKNPIAKQDILDGQSRTLQTVYNYDIWVYIDEREQTEVPVIETTSISTKTTPN